MKKALLKPSRKKTKENKLTVQKFQKLSAPATHPRSQKLWLLSFQRKEQLLKKKETQKSGQKER
jgi:hypothetical protein